MPVSFDLTEQGIYKIDVTAVDNWGNETVTTKTIKIDYREPGFSVGFPNDPNLGVPVGIPIAVDASDDMSGMDRVIVNIDGVDEQIGTSFLIKYPGHHTVIVKVYDKAGNREASIPYSVYAYMEAKVSASVINIKNDVNTKLILMTLKMPNGYECAEIDPKSIVLKLSESNFEPISIQTMKKDLIPLLPQASVKPLSDYLSKGTLVNDCGVLMDTNKDGKQELVMLFVITHANEIISGSTFPISISGLYSGAELRGSATGKLVK